MSRMEPVAWICVDHDDGEYHRVPAYTAEQIREAVEAVRAEWRGSREACHALDALLVQLEEE